MAKVKATAKKVASKVKSTKKKAVEGTKTATKKAKTYSGQLKTAYNEGYAAGYEAAQNLPDVVGARHVATTGFNNGCKAKQKSEKAKTKVTRIRANAKS